MTVELPPKATKKELLREFFLNATLIALINELGRESTRLEKAVAAWGSGLGIPERVPVPVTNFS
jgi:hypothetical protein